MNKKTLKRGIVVYYSVLLSLFLFLGITSLTAKPTPIVGHCYANSFGERYKRGDIFYEVDKVIKVNKREVDYYYTFPVIPSFVNKWVHKPVLSTENVTDFMDGRKEIKCPW